MIRLKATQFQDALVCRGPSLRGAPLLYTLDFLLQSVAALQRATTEGRYYKLGIQDFHKKRDVDDHNQTCGTDGPGLCIYHKGKSGNLTMRAIAGTMRALLNTPIFSTKRHS